jgi:adenylate cyclase
MIPLASPPARIFVVDDDPLQLDLLKLVLTTAGHAATGFTNGYLALAAAVAAPPELFILDVSMDEVDGITLCRHLKAHDSLRDVPVMFISGLSDLDHTVTGLDAGGVDYITKPFRVAEVNARVRTHLALVAERRKVEQLLRNILPDRAIRELKASGQTAPEYFHDLTVFFSDFVGFTRLASESSAPFLISELNRLFSAFDAIVARHGCERVKTVGDAYLAVGGNFAPGREPALALMRAAVEINGFLHEQSGQLAETGGAFRWRARIGLHTGDAIGAVVGTTKYLYDLFGDSVNTAARIQAATEPMQITLSQTTWELVRDEFTCRPRPPVELPGKGLVALYDFVRP